MLYRCRNCKYEEARGFLPTVTCGMLLFAQMALIGGALVACLRYLKSSPQSISNAPETNSDAGLGWWAIIVVPLFMAVGLMLLFFGAMILNLLLELIEWLAYCCRRCPKCSRRKWSWGFTNGFGL